MNTPSGILSTALVASGLLGVQILAKDRWLWVAAPSHAYGLVGFVVVDLALAVAVLGRVTFSGMAAALAALVQFGAMLGDMIAGQPEGVSSITFKDYLLHDTSYVGLLSIQISIMTVVLSAAIAPLFRRHRHWAVLLRFGRHGAQKAQ